MFFWCLYMIGTQNSRLSEKLMALISFFFNLQKWLLYLFLDSSYMLVVLNRLSEEKRLLDTLMPRKHIYTLKQSFQPISVYSSRSQLSETAIRSTISPSTEFLCPQRLKKHRFWKPIICVRWTIFFNSLGIEFHKHLLIHLERGNRDLPECTTFAQVMHVFVLFSVLFQAPDTKLL